MKDAVGSKLPVYVDGKVALHALVDADDFKKLSQFEWTWDDKAKACFRSSTQQGKTLRIALHREVMQCKKGDGKTLVFKSDDRLDCRKANLDFGFQRNLKLHKPGKFFPRKASNFIGFVKKNHLQSRVDNLLDIAEVTTYNTREIVFTIDEELDESKSATHHSFQAYLQTFMDDEFGYKGKLAVVVRKAPPVEPSKVVPVPVPAMLSAYTAATKPAAVPVALTPELTPAMNFLAKLKVSFGLPQESSFEFVNFGVREGDDVHVFQYSKKKIGMNLDPQTT